MSSGSDFETEPEQREWDAQENAMRAEPGFNRLPRNVQNELLNDPSNLQPMTRSANSSKNSRTEAGAGWTMWGDQPVSTAYREWLSDAQDAMLQKVRAAIRALRRANPRRLILAVPVAPKGELADLRKSVDRVICLATPSAFRAVGLHYHDFEQTSDEEVIALMKKARREDEG